MRSKSKLDGKEKQMNLFGWDEPSYTPASSISREVLDYGEWRRIAAEHMRNYWFMPIEEVIKGLEVVDEDMLRAAHKRGTAPKAFVDDLAFACNWIDFGPWSRR